MQVNVLQPASSRVAIPGEAENDVPAGPRRLSSQSMGSSDNPWVGSESSWTGEDALSGSVKSSTIFTPEPKGHFEAFLLLLASML